MDYVAFLRAINVGGRTVTMKRLRDVFVDAGFQNVSTFIASGNVLFTSRASNAMTLEARIESALASSLGFDVATMLRTKEQLAAVATFEPFARGVRTPLPSGGEITDYIAFLKGTPDTAAIDRVMGLASVADALLVHGRELYWQRRDRDASRVTGSSLERALGLPVTVRNVNTVRRMAAL